eukprot:TRINITY_DN2364_c0_g1_i1.p1 TRINITY_DN2364_c0_g1~~TRINITY_DN2364_c0_g1_i1.p1  ORF type:complete len:161 (-),score=22.26 TRINITY_DN2364_c0_g1_i1:150-632(-)
MNSNFINPAPRVLTEAEIAARTQSSSQQLSAEDCQLRETIYDLIRGIRDPEHPHTLEELDVVAEDRISIISPEAGWGGEGGLRVEFCPTVPHCSLATTIGLAIRSQITRHYPQYKLDISITPGKHATENEINKQLNDKERVSAALENPAIRTLLKRLIDD